MKNILSILIIMTGLLVFVASVHQGTASALPDQTSYVIASSTSPGAGTNLSAGSEITSKVSVQVAGSVSENVESAEPVKGNFFLENWGVLLMGLLGFADLVARLTPTEKDNSIVNFLARIINVIVPNLKKGGGRL